MLTRAWSDACSAWTLADALGRRVYLQGDAAVPVGIAVPAAQPRAHLSALRVEQKHGGVLDALASSGTPDSGAQQAGGQQRVAAGTLHGGGRRLGVCAGAGRISEVSAGD